MNPAVHQVIKHATAVANAASDMSLEDAAAIMALYEDRRPRFPSYVLEAARLLLSDFDRTAAPQREPELSRRVRS